jgi:hypothetical protein
LTHLTIVTADAAQTSNRYTEENKYDDLTVLDPDPRPHTH